MQSKVVSESFKGWFPDGFTREALNVGDVRDFGDATSGLMQAGFIEPSDFKPVEKEPETPTVETPAAIEAETPPAIVETPVETPKEAPTPAGRGRGRRS